MAEDFSKIFAQGATSKQSWTDSNYNIGWGYLGQEPPPYELFDYLFNRLDKKDKELYDVFNGFNRSWLDYVPVKRISDSTFRVTKGNLETEDIVINNVSHALSASTAITAEDGDVSTKIANTAFVNKVRKALVNNSPSGLQTLGDLANAINNDATFYETLTSLLALKAPLESPSFTGTVTGPTPLLEANNTQFATTAWVLQSIAAHATGPIVGDVSNANGWWVKIPCQGFNLLIQGGLVFYRRNQKIKFPVAFNSSCLSVIAFDKSDFGDDVNWIYGTGSYTTTDFFCLAERINGTYPDDCNCQYIAIGV